MRGLLRLDLDNSPPVSRIRRVLVGVGKGVARSEHGVGLGGQLLLLAQGAEFVADLTDRPFDRFHFHEQITHFSRNHEGGKDGEREEGARLPDEQ